MSGDSRGMNWKVRKNTSWTTAVGLHEGLYFWPFLYNNLSRDRKLSTEELMLLNCGVGEDSWESLGLQGDPPVNPKGNQSWIFIGRTDAEAETPLLLPPDVKNWLIGKDGDAGEDWRQ